jgi:hypothetical protein
MSKKNWLILAAILAVVGIGGLVVLALAVGFFFGHEEAVGNNPGLPVYTTAQSASSHAGYLHDSLTGGGEVYVHDAEEYCLEIATADPKPVVGRLGAFGNSTVCAIPGQPVTAYVAGDCGGEMPAFVPYRNLKQPPFDWRNASFCEMNFLPPGGRSNWRQSTNAALIAEVVRVLREGAPVELPGIPFTGTNADLSALKLTCDQLPGLLFCPAVYFHGYGTIYLAESETIDWTPKPAQVHARWIPASPLLTEWLKTP